MMWWYWIVLGLVLAGIELATPGGFFIIFFGMSAFLVGLLQAAGLARAAWLQWLLFSVIAVVALAFFREPLLRRMQLRERTREVDSLVGEVAVASTDIPPGRYGRAELRGSSWSARNVGEAPVRGGQRCRVVAVDGLMLDIRSE
jgi:membrane protein implicated in regulation of membrane protease activity